MAMGTVAATNIKTSGTQNVQWQEKGVFAQITTAAVTTALASTDVITCASIPAGAYLVDIIVDLSDIDGASSFSMTCGISGTAAKFIATNTAGRTGGIARMDVASALGYSPTSDTPVLITITATAGTPVAGTIKTCVLCTASP